MFKVFIKDMLDPKTIANQILLSILFYIGFSYLIENTSDFSNIKLSLTFIYFIAFAIFTTTYFFVKSYAGGDQILNYYSYPYKRSDVNTSFLNAIIVDTIVEKMSLVFIFLYLVKASPIVYLYVLLTGINISILSVVLNAWNADKTSKSILSVLGIIILLSLLILEEVFEINQEFIIAMVYSGLTIIYYFITKRIFFDKIFINSENSSLVGLVNIGNYFLKFILSERIYLINTLGIIIIIIYLSVIIPKPISIALAFAMATVNSPLLSIFSTERGLRNYNKMLPNKYASLSKQYLLILTLYFALANGLVLVLNYQSIKLKLIILAIIFTLIDTLVSYLLEKKFPIEEKKTDMAVWKSPRKYILSVLVFFISFIVLVIL